MAGVPFDQLSPAAQDRVLAHLDREGIKYEDLPASTRRTLTADPSTSSPRRKTRRPSSTPRNPKPSRSDRPHASRRTGGGRRVSHSAARGYRKAARELRPVVAGQARTGTQIAAMTLAVIALYLVVENAGPFAGFIGSIGKGLNWLADPSKSIAYGPNR